ncbi:MAG TPA: carbohydrate-binding family 9-like protein [Pyrinomonadaceae bacterium]|nr:carbohydrate-binding family 9-like protein [Pyrinomonadaceae bacterium]
MMELLPNEIVIAPRVQSSLSVDDLLNSNWDKASAVAITQLWSGQKASASRHAVAQICWSAAALHVRFIGQQNEPLVVNPNPVTDRKTLGLWDRDVCEIFIAPDSANPQRYFEFEAAPTGEWVDLGIVITPAGRETEWDYASGMQTHAIVEPNRIVIGMKIPWSDQILEPTVGDEWPVNLFRCIGPDEATRYLAWRPTRTPEPNFHVPGAFGWLKFV